MKTKKDFKKLHEKQPKKKSTAKLDNDKIKHLTRLIKLMITLNQGVLNLDNAAQENGVSRRTIQRDIDLLEKAGLPLYKPNPQNVNYRVRDDFEWAKFNITKENALQFADSMKALIRFSNKPAKWVLPIQKGVLEAGKKEQKKHKESKGKWVPTNATKENVFSIFLEDEKLKRIPLEIMLMLVAFNEFANDKTFHNSMYKKWQDRELQKTMVRFNWLGQRHAEALKLCRQLIKEDPKDVWPYKQAALIYYTKKDYNGALEFAFEGFDQNKKDETLLTYTIYFLILNKRYEQAIKLFNIYYDHKQMQTHFAAMMYAWVGLFDKALEVVAKAKKDDPKNTNVYDEILQQVLELKDKKQ